MAAPAAMALWDPQALRTALVELADNPEGRDAARIANMEDVAAASAAESPKSAPGEQHQPFWAKLRLELDTGKGTLVAFRNGERLSRHITGLQSHTLHAFVEFVGKGDKVRLHVES